MIWTNPTFHEVKMDAEIGSYNEEHDPARENPLAERHADGTTWTSSAAQGGRK
jgi:hypothetical protein